MTEPTLLLQEIESLLSKCKASSLSSATTPRSSNSSSSSRRMVITASDLYKIGQVLHELRRRHQQTAFHTVRQAFDSLLEALSPPVYRTRLFATLKQALLSVLVLEGGDVDVDDKLLAKKKDALNSVAELYQASEWATRATDWTLEDLSILLDQSSSSAVLAIISHWLLLHPTENVDWGGLLLPALHLVQSCDRWNEVLEWTNDHQPGWKSILLQHYPKHKEYLQSILEQDNDGEDEDAATNLLLRQAMAENDSKLHKSSSRRTSQQEQTTSTTTPAQELERRIDQVRQIFPNLGEGYIELILSYYKGNVEPTVTALAQDNVPLQLRHLDPSLPRRRHDTDQDDNDDEARMLAKAALQAAARQEEEEAYMVDIVMRQGAHDEYNDDYDDQYDDTEGFAVPDSTSYDAVHTYNRVLKQVIEDQQFWQDNRNTNQQVPVQQKKKADGRGEGKAYRGPDKLKGGRIPQSEVRGGSGRGGRGRGGRGGRGNLKSDPSSADANDPSSKKPDQQKQQQGGVGGRGNGQKGNTRAKERKMANRRDRQQKAAAKRTG